MSGIQNTNNMNTEIDNIVRQCIEIRKQVELKGIHSDEYEQGFWDALQAYEDHIKSYFGIVE